jgi:HAD superfamily hydrolase (TIGR01549 family)
MNKIIKEIKQDVSNFDIAFFDIFDTIVTRKVAPEYVKKIWASFLTKTLKINLNPNDLYAKRNEIEATLCKICGDNGFDLEFKYKDMVKELHQYLIELNLIEKNYNEFFKICSELEIEIESNVQEVDQKIFDLIKFLKEKNKKVICISDMYLSKDMLMTIFENKGISKYIDDIYVSEQYSIAKRSGRLFKYVLDKNKIDPKKCIMIGDNKYSDYEIPKSLGINAFLLPRDDQRQIYEKFSSEINEANIYNKINEIIKAENKLLFVDTIYSLYNFIEKLYFKLLEDNAKDVIFFSREGEYLKKLFDEYQKTIFSRKIKSHYILVSRRSTYLPSLNKLKDEKFTTLFKQYNSISLVEFLKSLNFNTQEIEELKNSLNIKTNFSKRINNFKISSVLKKLKNNKQFIMLYEEKRKTQNQMFKKYIKTLNLVDSKNIHVVDVGWKGSIQNNIQNIMKETKIKGYYLGISVYDTSNLENKEGLLFHNYPYYTKNFSLFNENRPLYEIILGASHGSAECYYEEAGIVKTQTYHKKEEQDLFNNTISPIQDEMFEKFIEIKLTLQNRIYDFNKIEKIFNKQHYKMLFLAKKKDFEFFNNIYHYENFGFFSFTKFDDKKKLPFVRKIKEYLKYFLRHNIYISDYYWCQLKNYNNGLNLLIKIYALERYLVFKKKNII